MSVEVGKTLAIDEQVVEDLKKIMSPHLFFNVMIFVGWVLIPWVIGMGHIVRHMIGYFVK